MLIKALKAIFFIIGVIVGIANSSDIQSNALSTLLLIIGGIFVFYDIRLYQENQKEINELKDLKEQSTCIYLSDSHYIRCAVNPQSDTCLGCKHFHPKSQRSNI
jgi:predicted MPP superfamily phosphohydrolase